MPLLNKLHYLQLLQGQSKKVDPSADVQKGVLKYASKVWPSLDLKTRTLTTADIAMTYEFAGRSFVHVRAFPKKRPDTFVIVVTDKAGVPGDHILFDIAAEYGAMKFECPQSDFDGEPTREDIERMIPAIDAEADNPYAILESGDGTYLQTFRSDEGFELEYQLVNTSNHYSISKPTTGKKVAQAMISYAFGKNEWLEMFEWKRQKLE